MTKRLARILWLTTVLLVIAAGSVAAETLTFLVFHPEQTKLDNLAVERFEADHPGVTVDVQMTPDGYMDKVLTMIVSGTAPDVIIRNTGGELLPLWLDGHLLDLTSYVQKNPEHVKGWIPAFIERGKFQGHTYAIPRTLAGIYINWFNRRLFDKAGLAYPDGSWDFAEFRSVLQKLTEDTDGDGTSDQYGYTHAWNSFQPFLYNNGGGLVDPEDPSRVLIGNRASLEALEYLQRLQFEDQVIVPDHGFSGGAAVRAFTAQRAAIMLRSATQYGNLPEEMKDGQTLGIALNPRGDGIRRTMSVVGGFAVPKASKNPDLAFELIMYLTDEEQQRASKEMFQGLVTNNDVNLDYLPSNLPVWNYDAVIQEAVSQPMFNVSEMIEAAEDIVDEVIEVVLETNEMPAAIAVEEHLPSIVAEVDEVMQKR